MIILLTMAALLHDVLAVIVFIVVFALVIVHQYVKYLNSQAHANRVAEASLRELRKINKKVR